MHISAGAMLWWITAGTRGYNHSGWQFYTNIFKIHSAWDIITCRLQLSVVFLESIWIYLFQNMSNYINVLVNVKLTLILISHIGLFFSIINAEYIFIRHSKSIIICYSFGINLDFGIFPIKNTQTPPSLLISLLWMMASVVHGMGKIMKTFLDLYFSSYHRKLGWWRLKKGH